MKRTFHLAWICLILGALTTLAVAWGFALLEDPVKPGPTARLAQGRRMVPADPASAGATGIMTYDPDRLIISRAGTGSDRVILVPQPRSKLAELLRPAGQGEVSQDLSVFHRFLPEWSHPHIPEGDGPRMILDARGWPVRCLWCRLEYDSEMQSYEIVEGGLGIGQRDSNNPDSAMALPLRPLLSGFALDTLFYGALWFVLLAMAVSVVDLRRAFRTRAGHCVACGYSLRGLAGQRTCPECGARCT